MKFVEEEQDKDDEVYVEESAEDVDVDELKEEYMSGCVSNTVTNEE